MFDDNIVVAPMDCVLNLCTKTIFALNKSWLEIT